MQNKEIQSHFIAMRTQISDKKCTVYLYAVRNNSFVIGESVVVVILWDVYPS